MVTIVFALFIKLFNCFVQFNVFYNKGLKKTPCAKLKDKLGKIFIFHIKNKGLIFSKHKDHLLETAKNTYNPAGK